MRHQQMGPTQVKNQMDGLCHLHVALTLTRILVDQGGLRLPWWSMKLISYTDKTIDVGFLIMALFGDRF
jgi:hypothetical protein